MTTPRGAAAADVVIVGGGAIGLAAAWRLAQRGVTTTVVDPSPGAGASSVAAGMIAPVTEARMGEDALLRLNLASWRRWPAFADELERSGGTSIGFRTDGTLVVGLDADDRVALADMAARHRQMGLDTEILPRDEARRLEPGLSPRVRAAALAAGERSVDTQMLCPALRGAAAAAGVAVVEAEVERIVTDAYGRAIGVSFGAPSPGGTGGPPAGSELLAGTVVLAAGCRSGQVAGLPDHVVPPVRPVKGQVLVLRRPDGDPLITRTVRGVVRGAPVYLVPRGDGRLVVGATSEERGWDTSPTAGATYELLRDALALVPGLDEAELVAVRAGLRPGSPDDLPLIGRSRMPGLVVATGHFRNGILLTPVTADAVAAAVLGEPLPDEVAAACDPDRFVGAGR